MNMKIDIERDLGGIPTKVKITRLGRTIKATFDGEIGLSIVGNRHDLPSFAEALRMVYPVSSVLNVRGLNWFDRNPESQVGEWSNTLAPHAETARISYTCPKDKLAMIEILNIEVYRLTAAAPASTTSARWKMTPAGGSETVLCTAHFLNANVDTRDRCSLGATMMLIPDDMIKGYTIDNSTGGTINYRLSYKLTEFTL